MTPVHRIKATRSTVFHNCCRNHSDPRLPVLGFHLELRGPPPTSSQAASECKQEYCFLVAKERGITLLLTEDEAQRLPLTIRNESRTKWEEQASQH
ncbi:hypothetical protein JZ751_001600 [Albula glossodonta]|uniref:Uncharacterized protein n=1 Tax=Albula glossodonta TaxID=121402 RepID=A0A8T2PTX8_9TELE|nr:hypothetical protein JZ751_001600 [Albula glossodonta]